MSMPAARTRDDMLAAALAEVTQLHHYLEAWLKGEIGEPGSEALRLAQALHSRFRVIHPSGQMQDRQAVLENFRLAHGSRQGSFAIRIDEMSPQLVHADMVVISFIETHHDRDSQRRRSTAILEVGRGRPPLWHYLHETRLAAE